MKNTVKYSLLISAVALLLLSCQDDDQTFGEIIPPNNIKLTADVLNSTDDAPYGDGSGTVEFTANAEHVTNFSFEFGDGSSLKASADGKASHSYTQTGVNTYLVTAIAYGMAGTATSTQTEIKVRSDFDDPETAQLLTGGSSKKWYIARNMPAHLGVGPSDGTTPDYYAAAPNEKAGNACFYEDELVFTLQEDGSIIYNNNNNGKTFFNADFLNVAGGSGGEDECLPFDTSGDIKVALASAHSEVPEELTTGTQLVFNDNAFMSYYIGTSNYEILEITDNYMEVRAIMGSDPSLAWYLKFTTDPEGNGGADDDDKKLNTQFTDLIWEADFENGETLDPDTWNFETGNNNGWGNQESQYYTKDNTSVEDGVLKITAKAENREGFNYTSSRLTTKDKFDFKYGRIEVRAKLPKGGGTWPAIWLLGDNFDEVGWPESGEIDIMEHAGNSPGLIHGTLHFPGNSGKDAITETTTIDDVSEEFNNYTLEWDKDHLIFAVNDEIFQEYPNSEDLPFNQPFFIILNVAMGGTFGGDIDEDFQEGTMEIKYIKVFQ